MNRVTLQFIHTLQIPPDTLPFSHEASLCKTMGAKGTKPQCRWPLAPMDLTDLLAGASKLLALFLNRAPVKIVLRKEKTFSV